MQVESQSRKLRLSKESLRRLDPKVAPEANLSCPTRSCFEPDLCPSFGPTCAP